MLGWTTTRSYRSPLVSEGGPDGHPTAVGGLQLRRVIKASSSTWVLLRIPIGLSGLHYGVFRQKLKNRNGRSSGNTEDGETSEARQEELLC